MTRSLFCISTDQGRSAVIMAPMSSGVIAIRWYRLAAPLLIRRANRSGGASQRVVSPLPLLRCTAEYGEIEYGGLPVNLAVFVIMLCFTVIRLCDLADDPRVPVLCSRTNYFIPLSHIAGDSSNESIRVAKGMWLDDGAAARHSAAPPPGDLRRHVVWTGSFLVGLRRHAAADHRSRTGRFQT
jgi:hypothetical protein